MTSPTDGNLVNVSRIVWLTFDDGPHPVVTPRILEVLAAYRVKATFFVLGSRITHLEKPILARVDEEGHTIGNHGFSHRDLRELSPQQIRDEVRRTADLIAEFRHMEMIFRPPYGASNPVVDQIVEELGYRLILWDVDSRDWHPELRPDRWIERTAACIRAQVRPIVLAHDIHETTADHLGSLIERIGDVRFARLTVNGEKTSV